jgi:hypothetical protein
LNVGSIGIISLARDREVPRLVAVKEMKPQFADLPGMRTRFLR